jgi:hypothetical protein
MPLSSAEPVVVHDIRMTDASLSGRTSPIVAARDDFPSSQS